MSAYFVWLPGVDQSITIPMRSVTRPPGNPEIATRQSSFLSGIKSETVGALGRDIDLYGVCGGCVGSDFISAESELRHDAERRFPPQGTPWIPRQ
jgi:hypothetical protein